MGQRTTKCAAHVTKVGFYFLTTDYRHLSCDRDAPVVGLCYL
jgi:hypothetical protein